MACCQQEKSNNLFAVQAGGDEFSQKSGCSLELGGSCFFKASGIVSFMKLSHTQGPAAWSQ